MTEPANDDLTSRIEAVLGAFAAGDAMGRATEGYRPDEIIEVYEDAVTEFVEPVRLFDDEVWAKGETGDATTHVVTGHDALTLTARIKEYAGIDLLPLGVALGLRWPLSELPGRSVGATQAAVAAGVSAALDGLSASDALESAALAARDAGDGALAESIMQAGGIAQASGGRRSGEALREDFPPDGDARSVVAFVFGIVYATSSARRAIVEAVSQGGHAPETAAIAGAICAALTPASFPRAWGETVERVNSHNFRAAATAYARRRGASHA
ncbi:MAG: ADP-ribosylglycohydrolase family protein [Chloroflexi bacterium]|nr:ADP-ribosylglycohydrolase family protein [Chloroflexota bacterium]